MGHFRFDDRVLVFAWAGERYLRGEPGTVVRARVKLDCPPRLVVLLDKIGHDGIGIMEVGHGDVVRAEPQIDGRALPVRRLRRDQLARRFRAWATPLDWSPDSGSWTFGDGAAAEVEHTTDLLRRFGAGVRRQRRKQGMTQLDLATRAEIDRDELSRIERGLRDPGLVTMTSLAQALAVDSSSLLSG
jgi:DNA-binding XRE family transcriptional regulator